MNEIGSTLQVYNHCYLNQATIQFSTVKKINK